MFFRVATWDSSAVAIRLVTDRAAYPFENTKKKRGAGEQNNNPCFIWKTAVRGVFLAFGSFG